MDLYVVIDSIRGASNSIGVAKQPFWQQTPVFEGEYIQVYDGFSNGNLKYHFYDTDTVYFSIRALGTPLIPGQSYPCTLNMSVGLWSHGCSNFFRTWHKGPQECAVLDGAVAADNTSCDEATLLEPGMNWVYNLGVETADGLALDCWNNGEGGDVQKGVWYTFTTPDVPVVIDLETSSSDCDSVELAGAQIALFDSCSSDPLHCSSPGAGSFGELEFDCGELSPNTTYYLLVDSYDGQEGVCNLSFQQMYSCQDLGCLDPEACNFDPDADIEDGSCVYGNDCDPEFTISIDTIDCQTYSLFAEPFSWSNPGGLWHDGFGNTLPGDGFFLFQPTSPGIHSVCYSGIIDSFAVTSCVELYVDPTCFIPCANEIILSSDSAGCMLSLSVLPFPPEDAAYAWDLGNGSTSDIGPLTEAVYEASGTYEVCVEVTSANCNNIQICDSIEIQNCPVTEPIAGCTDPAACNYDPEASTDNGMCLYGEGCSPGYILTVDSIDCGNFSIGVSPYEVFLAGAWTVNSEEADGNEILNLNFTNPGIYEICYSGNLSGLGDTSTCIEIAVDSLCFSPCLAEVWVSVDSTGCEVSFEIPPPIPTDAQIAWSFGSSGALNWTNLPFASHTYESDGEYTLLVVMTSTQCETAYYSTQLSISCAEDEVPGCTDPEAVNYNPEASVDDNSCIYDPNCSISIAVIPDTIEFGSLIIIPSFDPLEASEILWSFGDGAISYDPFPSHEYADGGPYTLCCTATFEVADSLVCTSEYCIVVTGFMAGSGNGPFSLRLPKPESLNAPSSNESKPALHLWPNPTADGILNWRLDSRMNATLRLEVYASNGQKLHSEKIAANRDSGMGTFNTSQLAGGIYLMVVETGKGVYRSTFIVQ